MSENIPIMGYAADEKETVILFDYEKGTYNIHTNVPSHITKCYKQYSEYEIKVVTVHTSGEPSCIKVNNVPNAITFRNPKKRESNSKGNPNIANLKRNNIKDLTE